MDVAAEPSELSRATGMKRFLSTLQAMEDVHIERRLWLKITLHYADRTFTIIFVCEMVIKMMAYGFKKYFTDAWCWLDFVIVVVGVLSVAAVLSFPPLTL